MLFLRAFVAACLLWGASLAHAETPGPGAIVSQQLFVNDKLIPLPQGNWTVVSVQNGKSTLNNGLTRLFLADVNPGGVLSRWIYVGTNADYNRGGWKRDKDICDRKNVHFAYSDSNHNDNDAECWAVNHWGMTLGQNASQAAIDFYRWSDGLRRPNTSVGAAYFFAKRGDFLHVELVYNPVVDGFRDTTGGAWRGNPWHADIASKDPKKLAYLKALKDMGEQYFQKLRTVLH